MNSYTLYWIYDKNKHTDPFTQGYVGITKRSLAQRLSEHLNEKEWIKERDYEIVPLVENLTEQEALDLEIKYRPTEYIGWNKAKGGQAGNRPFGIHTSGFKHTEEQKAKRKDLSIKNGWVKNLKKDDPEIERKRLESVKRSLTGIPNPIVSEANRKRFKENPGSHPFFGKSGSKSPTAVTLYIDDLPPFGCWEEAIKSLNKSQHLIRKNHKVYSYCDHKGWYCLIGKTKRKITGEELNLLEQRKLL